IVPLLRAARTGGVSSGAMKLVTAVVKPHRIEEVKDALRGIGVSGLTTSDVEGFGRQWGQTPSRAMASAEALRTRFDALARAYPPGQHGRWAARERADALDGWFREA